MSCANVFAGIDINSVKNKAVAGVKESLRSKNSSLLFNLTNSSNHKPPSYPNNDIAVEITYRAINTRVKEALKGGKTIRIDNINKPVISKKGGNVAVGNISADLPAYKKKVNFEFAPQKIQNGKMSFKLAASSINSAKIPNAGFLNNLAVDALAGRIVNALNSAVANKTGKIVSFKQNKGATMAQLDLKAPSISPLFPSNALNSVNFGDKSVSIGSTASATGALRAKNGCNVLIGQALVWALLQKISTSELDFRPNKEYPTGISFAYPGKMNIALSPKINTGVKMPWPYKGKPLFLAFTAVISPSISANGNFAMELKKITVNRIYAGDKNLPNVPLFIQNYDYVQKKITGAVVNALSRNKELKKYTGIKKISDSKMEFAFKPAAFIPALNKPALAAKFAMDKERIYFAFPFLD